MNAPGKDEIRAAREAAGLTKSQAGALVHVSYRTWQKWESGDRAMHPAFWDLFCRKSIWVQHFPQRPYKADSSHRIHE